MAKVNQTYTVGDALPTAIKVGDFMSSSRLDTEFCYRVLNVARHLTNDSKIVIALEEEDGDVFFENFDASTTITIKRWIEVK